MAEVISVDRNWFAPANSGEKKHDGSQGVEVSEGVKGETTISFWGGVTETVGGPGVGELVETKRNDERNKIKGICHILKRRLV